MAAAGASAINDGRLPWWIFSARRAASPAPERCDYLGAWRLLTRRARGQHRRGHGLPRPASTTGSCGRCRWPRSIPSRSPASARLAGTILQRDAAAGAARPAARWWRREASPTAFIDPALAWLAGARRRRCASAIACAGSCWPTDGSSALDFGEEAVALAPGDAVDPCGARARGQGCCCRRSTAPESFRAIVNAHYKIDAAAGLAAHPRRHRRHGRMALRLRESSLGHHQRRRPADRQGSRGSCPRPLGRGGGRSPAWRRACRPGRSSRSAGPPLPPCRRRRRRRPGAETRWPNLRPGGRLDGDGPAGHHRGGDPLRQPGGRIPCIKGVVSRARGRVKPESPGTAMQAFSSVQPSIADPAVSPADLEGCDRPGDGAPSWRSSARTAIGSSSSRPMPRSRPNMSC